MSRGRQYIEFHGLFSEAVLGTFRIIRGFADLRDLAAVSVPYKMESDELTSQVTGHQRVESNSHAEDIKRYLELSDNRFLPEVILSVRTPINLVLSSGEIPPDELVGMGQDVLGVKSQDNGIVAISRPYASPNIRLQKLRVRCADLDKIEVGWTEKRNTIIWGIDNP